ncbi:nuclear transport factor 2 family protein, partial [Halomonas sp. SIMBA_159]
MSDDQEILFANAAFYAAFADGDLALMDRLWARATRVACLHPGWEPLIGRDAVMESWRAILASPPDIECSDPEVFVQGGTGFVICREQV